MRLNQYFNKLGENTKKHGYFLHSDLPAKTSAIGMPPYMYMYIQLPTNI